MKIRNGYFVKYEKEGEKIGVVVKEHFDLLREDNIEVIQVNEDKTIKLTNNKVNFDLIEQDKVTHISNDGMKTWHEIKGE